MRKQPDYATVLQKGTRYAAYFKGRFHGVEDTKEAAWALLWNGPIGDDLIAFQKEMDIKRAAHIAAEKRRKELDAHEPTA